MNIEYDLTVETEYHIGTGLEHPGVVDRTLITRFDGTLVIPAEHFRGLVRDACTQILYFLGKEEECCEASLTKAPLQSQKGRVPTTCGLNFRSKDNPCVLCRLFGTTFIPKRYHFFDNIMKKPVPEKEMKRVSMHNRVDPATGRVPEDTFFSFEVGTPVTFTGRIERYGSENEDEIGLLLAGLRLVERVGARSGRGWGRCRVKITNPKDVDERLKTYLKIVQERGEK